MRGKPLKFLRACTMIRITPADAGKTFVFSSWRQQQQDHPRGCGENEIDYRTFERCGGSPPRMRGKPDTPADETEQDRITPADAGKTRFGGVWQHNHKDHPRGCGENINAINAVSGETGSPPRMRGKRTLRPRA